MKIPFKLPPSLLNWSAISFVSGCLLLNVTACAQPIESSMDSACAALAGADYSGIPTAATRIESHSVYALENGNQACKIDGYVEPQVGFALHLPAPDQWNEKFMFRGCGGFCGAISNRQCAEPVARGYACVVTDMGHQSSSALRAKWAHNNRQAEIDFAFRATHVTTVAAKAISADYYGQEHKRAYFYGCSTGGRQGMMSAQRFPNDFDGIIAGAPAMNYAATGLILSWSVLANLDDEGKPILKPGTLELLNAAVIEECDGLDGKKDGVLDHPRACTFKPESLLCSANENPDACLTSKQVGAVKKIYQGPVNSRGEALTPGGPEFGSELNWIQYVGTETEPANYYDFLGDYFRYLIFWDDPGDDFTLEDVNYDTHPDQMKLLDALYSALNPDMSAFKNRGGKLIGYHGWRDQSVVPSTTLDYYEKATRAMGGEAATKDFYRLFMIPGMNHCAGGEGPWKIDYISYLEDWVENGIAPETLNGTTIDGEEPKLTRMHPIHSVSSGNTASTK